MIFACQIVEENAELLNCIYLVVHSFLCRLSLLVRLQALQLCYQLMFHPHPVRLKKSANSYVLGRTGQGRPQSTGRGSSGDNVHEGWRPQFSRSIMDRSAACLPKWAHEHHSFPINPFYNQLRRKLLAWVSFLFHQSWPRWVN